MNRIGDGIGVGVGVGPMGIKHYTALLTSTGTGAGVATLRLEVSTNMTVTLDGAGRFYTDAAGTLGESTTWIVTAGALRTIYLKCPSGSANLYIPDVTQIIRIGNTVNEGWVSGTNAPSIALQINRFKNLLGLRIGGTSTLVGSVPPLLTYLNLTGNLINWSCSCSLPTGLTYLFLSGNMLNWSYNGALPAGLTVLYLSGNLIAWTYNGAIPSNVGTLVLNSNLIAWTYAGALPNTVAFLSLTGNLINWTGLSVGTGQNMTSVNLANYRITKMSSADMVTLLTQLTNRTGTLPSSITINDYADALAPPIEVTNAVATLKATKGITTVNLGI